MDGQKKIVVAHPTGNANTRGAVDGFYKQGMLDSFHTSIACFENSWYYRLAIGLLKDFRRRTFSAFLRGCTYTYPHKELGRMLAFLLGKPQWTRHEKGKYCVDAIYRNLDECVSKYILKHRQEIIAIYGYEDGALNSFRQAKALGMKCVYDLPIGYWRSMHRLLGMEREQNPDWAMTLNGFNDSDKKLERKDEELALADKIYVASNFTKKTLEEYPGTLADVVVIPYGFPPVNQQREYLPFEGRKIKLLFVGGLSQRKGLSYIFEAIKGLEDKVELTVVGGGDIDTCPALKEALGRVSYISTLPHDEILNLMAVHDLLLFPSLFEGFGLVVTEAMSQGTPVITTDRTCGPDVMTHGKDGWIVEAGTAIPIRELIEIFIANPILLEQVGRAARQTAMNRPWSCYEKELAQSVAKYLYGKLS